MKASELTGALLDYWVARAEGFEWAPDIAPHRGIFVKFHVNS
jgi:hypothetical protein